MHLYMLFSCFFIPFSIEVTSLGDERAGLCTSHVLFVCFAGASLFFSRLVSEVECGL